MSVLPSEMSLMLTIGTLDSRSFVHEDDILYAATDMANSLSSKAVEVKVSNGREARSKGHNVWT